jgi:hypothetical protein
MADIGHVGRFLGLMRPLRREAGVTHPVSRRRQHRALLGSGHRDRQSAEDLPGTPADGLRAAMITKIESRIAAGFNRIGLREDLRHLRAGETVQLYRSEVPRKWLPPQDDWRLYELRGERLVGVPTQMPGAPRPPEWTVP